MQISLQALRKAGKGPEQLRSEQKKRKKKLDSTVAIYANGGLLTCKISSNGLGTLGVNFKISKAQNDPKERKKKESQGRTLGDRPDFNPGKKNKDEFGILI